MKRISIGSWAYSIGPYQDKPVPWGEVLTKLKEMDFDGVELGGFPPHPNPDDCASAEQRQQVVSQLKEIGLAFSGLAANLWGEQLINTEDTSKYVDEFTKNVKFCVDVGIPGIRVDCVQPPEILNEVDYDVAKKRVVETWKKCANIAQDQGVYMTWEFEPGFAFNKPSDIQRILDEVGHDNFGVQLDTCHAQMVAVYASRQPGEKETLPGGALELINRLKGKINHIHLIDSDGTLHDDETSTHAPFGDGELNFDEIVPALNESGCPHDWWTIDLCFWPDAWDVTRRCKNGIDELNKKYGGN
ncbi:MAG: sugar phosphate isomerase/epimerase family protein [Candidatus Hinthialibacter antarcticus]|nr:sugar phosphate isomerase/epimerase family protein [Candidatus Hinthialibacter antarcticus]